MSGTHHDMITWSMMLRKLPAIVKALPRVVKGLKIANVKQPDQPCGLAFTFEQATLRNPAGPALLQGSVVLSYSQVNQWANRFAHYLLARGLKLDSDDMARIAKLERNGREVSPDGLAPTWD